MGEVEDKETQTEPAAKPDSPATPRRPMPTTRQAPMPITRQPPAPRPQQPIVKREPPRPQQPIVKREPRPVAQPKPPPNVQVATAAGKNVAETLPPARGALPSARPVLPPKRQWQKSIAEIHVPTTLLKRRGPAAEKSFSSSSGGAPADSGRPVMDTSTADPQAADMPITMSETAIAAPMPAANAVGPATAGTVTAAITTVAEPRRGSVQTSVQTNTTAAAAARPASPQLAIMTAGNHVAPVAATGPGAVRSTIPAGSHAVPVAAKGPDAGRARPAAQSTSLPSASAKSGVSNHSDAAADAAAGLSMLGHSNNQQGSRMAGQQKPESQAVVIAAYDHPEKALQLARHGDMPVPLPAAADVLADGTKLVPKQQPDREVLTIGEGGELRPMTASTDQSLDSAPSLTTSRLQTPAQPNRATGEIPVTLPAALEATQEDPAALNANAGEPSAPPLASTAGDASVSRLSTADTAEPSEQPMTAAETGVQSALPPYHAPPGRSHRNTVRTRPQSPLQSQISSMHGSNPTHPSGGGAPAAGSGRTAQRAQHAAQPGRQSKVPPLNMAVMRALKQQVSGLVPLSGGTGHATSKTARTVLQQTASSSQQALANRQAPAAGLSPKKDAHSQLTPLSSSALCSRNLPDGSPLATLRHPPVQANVHMLAAQTAASQPHLMLPGVLATGTPRQTLSLEATVQLIGDMYDSKGVADLAALRQQAPCQPLQEFVQQYLQRRFGTGSGGSWMGAWQQLEAAVGRHADDARVAAFATSCGLLQPVQVPSSAQVCLMPGQAYL